MFISTPFFYNTHSYAHSHSPTSEIGWKVPLRMRITIRTMEKWSPMLVHLYICFQYSFPKLEYLKLINLTYTPNIVSIYCNYCNYCNRMILCYIQVSIRYLNLTYTLCQHQSLPLVGCYPMCRHSEHISSGSNGHL